MAVEKAPVELRFSRAGALHDLSLVVLVPVNPKLDWKFIRSATKLVKRAAAPFRDCRLVFDPRGTPPPPNVPMPHRLPALARIRQDMVDRYLGDADWVIWLDADIVDFPADLFSELVQRADGGIAAPIVLMEGALGSAPIARTALGREDSLTLPGLSKACIGRASKSPGLTNRDLHTPLRA